LIVRMRQGLGRRCHLLSCVIWQVWSYMRGQTKGAFTMIRLILVTICCLSTAALAQTKGALETPSKDSYISGKYMFSGWACDAELIEIVIDGGSGLKAAYGTTRGDTQSICGDSDNGFGLLYNMSTLGTGEHTAVAFADGLEIGRSTFYVQQLSTGNFLRGAESLALANNFPEGGRESWLWWTQSAQNFVIAHEQEAIDPYNVAGIWYNDSDEVVISITTNRVYEDRSEVYVVITPYEPFDGGVGSAWEGYLVGNTLKLFSVLPESVEGEWTITFADPLNAIVKIDRCVSYDPRIYCTYNNGASVSIRKLAGANTGRSAVQDGNPLAPIDETWQVTPLGE